MKIVVISPTYNEKENIEKMIPVLEEQVFPKVKNHDIKFLVADDGSPDGTADVVKQYMKKWVNIELLDGEKKGLGKAYARAMRYAMEKMHADAVIEFDADFQHDPHDIPRLISAMDEGYDYVIGSRYIPGGEIPAEWGIDRKIKSILGGMFARYMFLMFRIHDMTSGFKLTKTTYLSKVDLEHLYSFNYAYKLHILHDVVRLGAKVKEIPIVFYERTKGESKMDTNDITESFLVVLRLAWKDYQRILKFLVVGGTGFIVQLIAQETSVRILHLADNTSVTIGAECAIISNFLINHFWTFSDTSKIKENSSFVAKLLKFNLLSLPSILLQRFSVIWLIQLIGEKITIFSLTIPTRIAVLFPVIIFLVIPMNYLMYNKLVWKTQYLKKHGVSQKT